MAFNTIMVFNLTIIWARGGGGGEFKSHLLKKSSIENFIFRAVDIRQNSDGGISERIANQTLKKIHPN